jgi:hypothetical protein
MEKLIWIQMSNTAWHCKNYLIQLTPRGNYIPIIGYTVYFTNRIYYTLEEAQSAIQSWHDSEINKSEESKWLSYPENKPTEYGKYEVYRSKCKKQHYEVWNTTGWASNNNDITHYRKIISPKQD